VACAIGGIQDLVVENREVEGQAKTDGVGWGELGLRNIGSILGKVSAPIIEVFAIAHTL
jgi:hypothetical protein